MCKSCSKSKPCKSCKTKIGAISIDKVIANADLTQIGAATLGVAFGEFVHSKVKNQSWTTIQFRMFVIGLAKFIGGLYGSSTTKNKFWQGFYSGLAASGTATILRFSGVPAFAGIWNGSFLDGVGSIVEDVRYKIGNIRPVKKLPTVEAAKATKKVEIKLEGTPI